MKKILASMTILTALAALSGCGTPKQAVPVDTEDEAINIGYGKVTKKQNSFAASKVKVKEEDVASYSNIYDYLRGKVAGVSVGYGDPPAITIRGVRSVNSSNEPLILVDGMEMSDISSIAPNTVKSVEVLKDASTSIYGFRGANGVILITTK